MKSRNSIDSTDINNVFISGESAGGFVALATAFTDQLSEKSSDCFAIADAPNPDADMAAYGCIPANNNRTRPDLGNIDGTLHTGTYDATVKGVGNLFGGVLDSTLFQQIADTPVVYLFHQGSDVVVNYRYGRLLGRTSWECYAQTNICQTYFFYPNALGSESIREHFVNLGSAAPVYQADIVSNYSYLNDCFANGHSMDNFSLRVQNMVNLFADKIALSTNHPQTNCVQSKVNTDLRIEKFLAYPNPVNDILYIRTTPKNTGSAFSISDLQGREIHHGTLENEITTIDMQNHPKGIFILKTNTQTQLIQNN